MFSMWVLTAAAAWNVASDIDRSKIGLEDNLTLTIAVSGDKISNLSGPNFSGNDDWAFLNTNTSTSSNFQLVNGKMSQNRTVTYNIYLAPKQKGTLTIPKIEVSANGETKTSKSFRVEVVDGSIAPSRSQQRNVRQAAPSAPEPSQRDIGENLFISAYADKTEAYVGEQINVSFTLYTQYNLGEISMSKDAVFNGFWAKDLFRAKRLQYQRKTVKGKAYNAVVLTRDAIFGLSSGEKKIEPMELDCSVITNNSHWGFFSQSKKVEVVGRPLKIVVKPLPAGAPADFDGLVGDFSVVAETSVDQPKTNEAFSYTISVSGTGNLHIIDQPELEFPPGFELFDVQESGHISADGGKVAGTRKFEYILVPRSEGEFDISQWRLSYFDLKSKTYKYAVADPISLVVGEGKAEQSGGMQIVSRGEVMRVGEDIRFIAPDCKRIDVGTLDIGHLSIFMYILPLELLLILAGLIIYRRRERLDTDIGYARYTRAMKKAVSELRKAEARIEDSETFVAMTQNAILHYLADRLGLPQEGIVFSDTRDRLAERRVDDETLDSIEELLEKLNFLRFAPGEKDRVSKELLNGTKELIRKVDRAFR